MKNLWVIGLILAGTAHAADQLAVAPAQYRDVAQTHVADGLMEAVRQSTVSAQIGGRVVEIKFDVGDRVSQGQVILRIDEKEAVQSVAGSKAQVFQAQANMQNASAAYERAKQLFAQKFISQAALDKAQADYKVALAQLAASEAGASQASLARGYTAVVAPYSGIVSARLVEVGEMVMPGKSLMSGFDPAEMRVVASIPQDRIAEIIAYRHPPAAEKSASPADLSERNANTDKKMDRGIEALVEAPSLNRFIKPASIIVQPVADTRTHSTQVRVYLPKNEPGIYPGMFVRVHFTTGKARKLVIPASAVLRRSEVVAVYVVNETQDIKLRQVRLGEATADGNVEVLAGINAGEKVALDPVKAGMSVERKK